MRAYATKPIEGLGRLAERAGLLLAVLTAIVQ